MAEEDPHPGGAKPRRIIATVPPQEIVPVVDRDFESNVKGIFVIGDVTGLPLVKIGANQGVDLAETLARRGAFSSEPSGEEGPHDLVVIGAGPAGLSVAIEATKAGARCVVLEKNYVASTVGSFPPGKKVYGEPQYLANRSAIPVEGDPVKDDFLRDVGALVERFGLDVREKAEVRTVRKKGDLDFTVETTDGTSYRARRVVVAVGRQGTARTLGVQGEDLHNKTTYRLHTADDYRGKDILVVGGGNSAVEAALMLAPHNRVTLSYRREAFFRLKAENQRRLDAMVEAGTLTVAFRSTVKEIRQTEVDLLADGEVRTVPNDAVLVIIGTRPPIAFLQDMGLELDGVWTKRRFLYAAMGLVVGYLLYFQLKNFILAPDPSDGTSVTLLPGFAWLFDALPDAFRYFRNLGGLYYLVYFSLIVIFGIYWARRYKSPIIWKRNLTLIALNWTLWWGIPTFLAAFIGRNPWTPVLSRSLNAWPLNYNAFRLDPTVQLGDPAWFDLVGRVGLVWAVLLTFVILPLAVRRWGKMYCAWVCSCGALAETVGNAFRHRGPKGDGPRWIERFGYVFIALASFATLAALLGWGGPMAIYHTYVGVLLAGALAIGLYPFLGNRVWCRFWCPLAFWMNFWGRWSRFKITPEPGKCIDCNVCNQYCQMGIDIKTRALQGLPVTLADTTCVGCCECVARCPMEILHLGDLPSPKPGEGVRAGSAKKKDRSEP